MVHDKAAIHSAEEGTCDWKIEVLEANPIAQQTFRIVGGKVIKVTLVMKDIEAYCNDEFSAEITSSPSRSGRLTLAFRVVVDNPTRVASASCFRRS